ncbi:hypothetical protein BG015_009444 [Linnemannia schmuckeri]|uniref:G domain-containing protein n=1 Tax=Linnemannia schmuckeri TaxID=64567 RepID=A0A9P5RW06_9FUNG|nr:hypothetical protein BG015_009444 [Linnemannia schmuckeri]
MTVQRSFLTGTYSLILVGNPGVGKSTILNVLGGDFHTGFSAVTGLTRKMSSKYVPVDGRRIRLVDIPGIFDIRTDDNVDGNHASKGHLEILRNTLNDGNSYVIFFVIAPNNGRISPSDFTVMKALLDNLDQSPLVGLILTQVKREHYDAVRSSKYLKKIREVLMEANADLKFFSKMDPLILLDHSGEFTRSEENIIKDYILNFEPTPVFVHRMFTTLLQRIFAVFWHLIFGV